MATQAAAKKQGNDAHAVPPQEQALATAQPQTPAKKSKTIRELLEEASPKLKEVLPKHLSVDRLVRVTIAVINRTPTLLQCTKDSLLNAVMQAAQLGLEPTGVLGSAYLVPYKVAVKDEQGKKTGDYRWEAQLIVGYRGLIDLARRSGQIESIEAHIVHENDRFSCHYGLEPTLDHEPCWSGDPGNVKAAYAIAKLVDGGRQIEVMTRAQIDRIMRGTQSKGEWGPWKDHFEEMARKTAVRRIAKYLPLTPELSDALALEDEVDRLDPQDVEPAPRGVEGLKSVLAKDATVEAEAEPPHDPVTGEVTDSTPPSDEELADARAREAAEAARQT